jgi:hypothetical protein
MAVAPPNNDKAGVILEKIREGKSYDQLDMIDLATTDLVDQFWYCTGYFEGWNTSARATLSLSNIELFEIYEMGFKDGKGDREEKDG